MRPQTIDDPLSYSFGYHGWGTNTKGLVKLAADWERDQGRQPPLWVDVRWRRAGRAPEFKDNRFAEATGGDAYLWMRGLGNRAIETGGPMSIADPTEAKALSDTIFEAHAAGRRVIFFCACDLVRVDGATTCHRDEVASLVLAAAKRAKRHLTIVEWPGGVPRNFEFKADDRDLRGWDRLVIPQSLVTSGTPLLLPQATAFTFEGEAERLLAFLHTPIYSKVWKYRILRCFGEKKSQAAIARERKNVQQSYGLDPRSV
jgi:hypothetical protein